MSTVGNPGNAIPESGLLRERINNNYHLSKGTEKVPGKKTKGRDSSPSAQNDTLNGVQNDTQNVMLSGAKHLPDNAASGPEIKVKDTKTNLGFVYDGDVKKAILRIIDEETKKVVFQIPPEEVITKMKEDLKKENKEVPAGIIVDKKV